MTSYILLRSFSFSWAATISFSVLNPSQVSPPGGVAVFSGTITNNTGVLLNATDLFVNAFGFDPSVVTVNQLLGNPDFTIQTGATSPSGAPRPTSQNLRTYA